MSPPDERPVPAGDRSPSRRQRARTVAALGLGALGVLFAVLNLDEVDVNWVLGTWSTPLILVIAISFLLGAGTGLLVGRRRAARD
jgi:uncharacterized integral membrane protein